MTLCVVIVTHRSAHGIKAMPAQPKQTASDSVPNVSPSIAIGPSANNQVVGDLLENIHSVLAHTSCANVNEFDVDDGGGGDDNDDDNGIMELWCSGGK
jgi:hypothetical protein